MISDIAHAKLNIDLAITGRRDNGYHELDSWMVFTQWGDKIHLIPSNQFRFHSSGPYAHIFEGALSSTSPESENLAIKAVYLMSKYAGRTPDFCLDIEKNIPSGAGLGGGSADAACVMRMLNQYWDLDLSIDGLCDLGLDLGAELPVCLRGQPARVSGIGEVVTPHSTPTLSVLIVWPDHPLLTKNVFSRYRQLNPPFSSMLVRNTHSDIVTQMCEMNNDLSAAAISLCPTIAEIIETLSQQDGCLVSRMSGSGSACFGIFENEETARKAALLFQNAVVTKTLGG